MSQVQAGNKKTQKIVEKEEKKIGPNKKGKGRPKMIANDIESQEDEYYNVERILDFKKEKNKDYFYVKWEGYDQPTWEPRKNLGNVKQIIEQFWRNQTDKSLSNKSNLNDNLESSSNNQEASNNRKNAALNSTSEIMKDFGYNEKQKLVKKQQKQTGMQPKMETDIHNISTSSSKQKKEEEDSGQSQIPVKKEDNDEEEDGTYFKQSKSSSPNENIQKSTPPPSPIIKKVYKPQAEINVNSNKFLDDDAEKQKNNILNQKRNRQILDDKIEEHNKNNKSDSQIQVDHSSNKIESCLEIEGDLENHIPIDITKAIYKDSKFQYRVEWKQQKGITILSSLVPSSQLLQRYGDIIVHFYEEKALKRK